MSKVSRLAGMLLITSSLCCPALLHAQDTGTPEDAEAQPEVQVETPADAAADSAEQPVEGEVTETDISLPGGGIIVTGKRNRNPERSSGQVLTVLSEADIARTGESDIAGALARVSGLSLVGNGRVFVRGLGDRYSLALLNGLPLPSPEPLSRVVPLDIFPTNVVASSLVQKTFSANFPGEFGGGAINLTTKAIPTETFLDVSFGTGGDTLTTFQDGLTYFGSDLDSFGFDNGNRDIPSNLANFLASGKRISDLTIAQQEGIAGQLMPLNLVTLQRVPKQRVNLSGSLTAGTSIDIGSDATLGLIATASIKNRLRNRTVKSQVASADFSEIFENSSTFITDENVLVNALFGVGLDIGEHTIRWTNLYIRDALKTARLETANNTLLGATGFDFLNQQTAWFERQLMDSQIVTELRFDPVRIDLRGGYARTDREAPFNANVSYTRTNAPGSPYGNQFVAYLNQVSDTGITSVAFDDLKEELWFGGIDLTYEVTPELNATIGYAYSDNTRRSSSREFRPFLSGDVLSGDLIPAVGLWQPGFLLGGATLAGFNVTLTEATPFPVFDAALTVNAGYGLARWAPTDRLTIEAGVRYEDAKQTVALDQSIFDVPIEGSAPTNLANSYFLPGTTITWEAIDDLQLRFAASKTIARPQFRELVEQTYFDPESNRRFRGNPFLEDSDLINIEGRAEYYFGGPRKVSLAGFYKKIDNPIENFLISASGELLTSFANAPSAELYGAELDLAYGWDLASFGGSFFEAKQFLVLLNYTYTKSSISVGADDLAPIPGNPTQLANQLFDQGAPLVGQSDHVANLSIGIEDKDKVQQATILLNYASKRVTARGGALPDVLEDPGLTVDFVARTEVKLGGVPVELSFDARNIFGRDNFEYQELNGTRIDINTFRVGTSFSVGVKAQF
ncbi:TonB-dependent receptor domain-containing protein [Erythrobacter sp. NE805]|uniref:TonB-dependent receptor domain-containing protein n=1 Tax=Erythrobacter sp. NE805 TaxID=3389875 RepID=UPI00396B432E